MASFTHLPDTEPIRQVIKAAFDADLHLEGGWGYTQGNATIITANPENIPLPQLEHTIASMRTFLEMNMTLPKEERYGSINLNEKDREPIKKDAKVLHHIIYEISAMKEEIYAAFIDEYKQGYGKENFDMEAHFQKRKEATLIRIEPYWFGVSNVIEQ